MNRPIASAHRIAGFDDIAFLQHVIRNQQTARRKQAQDVRQKVHILSFRRIHENKIKRLRQLCQNLCCIALQQRDLVLPTGCFEVLLCDRNPFFIFFNRRNMAILRHVFAHKKSGITNGRPYLKDRRRPSESQ